MLADYVLVTLMSISNLPVGVCDSIVTNFVLLPVLYLHMSVLENNTTTYMRMFRIRGWFS